MKILKRILKVLAFVGIIFIILLGAFAAFTQTHFFQDRFRILLVSTLSKTLNGTVELGNISGSYITGFTIDSIAISHRGNPFVRTGKVVCKYDPLTLLEKKISIRYLILEKPEIHFIRSSDGEWNLAHLFTPSTDTTHSVFDWTAVIDDIELKNGSATVTDSLSLISPQHELMTGAYVEYHRWTLNDFNLQLSASIIPSAYTVKLLHASFYSAQPRFELTHFKGEFSISEKGVAAKNVIIQTGGSYIECDLKLRGTNAFRGINLAGMEKDSVQLQFTARNIDFTELKSFLPQLSFLDGSAFVNLRADGLFGDLDIRQLNVKVYQSSLNVAGNLRNLHKPDELTLNVHIDDSKISPEDVTKLMPSFHLPAFDSAGQTTIFAQFIGKPLDFKVKTILKGKFGETQMSGNLKLESTLPSYDASFSTSRCDLHRILGKSVPHSNLFAHGEVKGEGFSLDNMRTTLTVDCDSSTVRDLPLTNTHVAVTVTPHRLDVNLAAQSNDMHVELSGFGDFLDTTLPKFSSYVSLNNINIAKIFDTPHYESDLSLHGSVSGSGRTIDDFNSDVNLTLLPSVFQQHALSSENIRFLLDQHNPLNKKLSLSSSIADAEFAGRFDLDLAVAAIARQFSHLVGAIEDHALPPESVKVAATPFHIRPHTQSQRIMDFTYSLQVKDLEPIATLIEGERFNARADLNGTVRGSDALLSLSCNGTVGEFFVGSINKGILFNETSVSLTLDSLSDTQTLEQLAAHVNLNVGSGLVNATRIDSAKLALQYHQLEGSISATGILDSLYTIVLGGKTSVQPNTYVIDLENLTFAKGTYSWHNDQDVQLRINYDGTRVLHATMKHDAEAFDLSGILHHTGEMDITAALHSYNLSGLGVFMENSKLALPDQGFAGKANADLHLSGSGDAPIFTFNVLCESTSFRQTRVGIVKANIQYAQSSAAIDLSVRETSADSVARLIVKGILPINLAFSGIEDRFPNEEQNLHILSDGFDLGVLDPLLGELDNLKGKLNCTVTLAGTPREPQYGGSITLNDVSFIFTPNNIAYTLSAELTPSGDKILLKKFIVKNIPEEGVHGEATFSGSLSMKDYQISTFDVTAFGQLLVMTDATRKTSATLYGMLFTEIGPDGLSLSGTMQRPFLSGKLFVREANLTFPPVRENVTQTGSRLTLNYVVIDDTTKHGSFADKQSKFYDMRDTAAIVGSHAARTRESLLIDKLRYNLSIETQGTTAVRMIFTPSTNEELYAELEGKATVVNTDGTTNVYGDISVTPRSYYNFIRRFDATGTLKFVGQWDNPELNIQATYEGYHILLTDSVQRSNEKSPEQKVVVQLSITGTRNEPKLDMSMKLYDAAGREVTRAGDVQSDAISFILTGKFRDELTSRERENVFTNFGSSTGSSIATNLLSGVLTDFLRKELPFIRSAEIVYQAGTPSVNVTATPGIGYLRVGQVQNLGNASVSYQVSLGDLLNAQSIHDLFLEIQRRVEGEITEQDRKLTNEARIYYRFSF
jgi:hypothetical protein